MKYTNIINENTIPFSKSNFAGWVSPKGIFHEVDMYQHEKFLDEKGITFGDAFNTGWIRIVKRGNELNIQCKGKNRAIDAIDILFPLFDKNIKIYLDFRNSYFSDLNPRNGETFFLPHDKDKLYKFAR